MNGGYSQQARVLQGCFADRLPARNVEQEATDAWNAVDRLTTADPKALRENIQAITEMREKLDFIFEGALS